MLENGWFFILLVGWFVGWLVGLSVDRSVIKVAELTTPAVLRWRIATKLDDQHQV